MHCLAPKSSVVSVAQLEQEAANLSFFWSPLEAWAQADGGGRRPFPDARHVEQESKLRWILPWTGSRDVYRV